MSRNALARMNQVADPVRLGVRGPEPSSFRRAWAVLLAGGEGTRLLGATVAGERVDRPKQFCRFGRDDSLLGSTLQRARHVAEPERILPVVADHHREWWKPELRHLPGVNVLVQPQNRGTAVAILHALVHMLVRDDDPLLVVYPCDHGVDDEGPLHRAVDRALRAANAPERPLVLLGIVPGTAETQYGWIVPARGGPGIARAVHRFEEKPSLRDAFALMQAGGLWNSLIFAVSGRALLGLYLKFVPRLVEAYLWKMPDRDRSGESLEACYSSLPFTDFSRDVLERSVPHLSVVTVHDTGWTDLGTPARLESWLERQRRRTSRATREQPTRLLTP
jgi:mannose-1-phosphate guanylyltransferase